MTKKATSSRISTLAAKLLANSRDIPRRLLVVVDGLFTVHLCTLADFRAICASAISQDETKGQKPAKRTPKRATKRRGRKR